MSSLTDWLTQHEGKVLEFKRDVSSPDKLIKSIVAFANGAGGTLLVGVEDRTRRVCGVADPTKVEEQLANLTSDHIEPHLIPEIQLMPWRKTHVIVVRVYPSSTRPHFVKSQGLAQGAYVRVGSTNRRADPAQIEEMKRFVRGHTFDEEPLPELNTEAIDFRAASECFAEIRKLKRGDLRTLQLTTTHQHREVPTVGGILLFGRNRLKEFPEAYVRVGYFAGTDKTTILDSADIKDHLPRVVDEALRFIQRNTRQAIVIKGARHTQMWEFPQVAVREAVVNAMVHADYAQRGTPLRIAIFSDRLEIDNPGGLPSGLTIEDIHLGVSKLRNRVIGRVFHELGLIEQWGSGIQRMTKACLEAGLPAPVFEEISSGFRVTFHRRGKAGPSVQALDQAILDFVGQAGGASTSQIAAHIGRTPRAARDRLSRLLNLGLLVAVGSNPRDPRKVFHLTAKPTT